MDEAGDEPSQQELIERGGSSGSWGGKNHRESEGLSHPGWGPQWDSSPSCGEEARWKLGPKTRSQQRDGS